MILRKYLNRSTRARLHGILLLYVLLLLMVDAFLVFNKLSPQITQARLRASIEKEAVRVRQECANSKNGWRRCTFEAFGELAKGQPFSYSLQTVRALETIDPRGRDCHLMAHAIAISEMAKNPNSWKEFLKQIDPNYCTGGFIHGVVEGLSRYDPNFSLDEKTLPKICDIVKLSVRGGGGDQYCAHITGHILLAEKNGDIEEAVKVCEKIPKRIQYQCFGGLFMENITRDNLVIHGIAPHIPTNWKTTLAQQKLCEDHKGVAATGCWREISHMYVVLANDDPQITYTLCSRAKEEKDKNECFLHAAGLIVRQYNLDKSVKNTVCNPLIKDKPLFRRCVKEIVGTMMSASKSYAPETKTFCETIKESADKKYCLSELDRRVKTPYTPKAPKDD